MLEGVAGSRPRADDASVCGGWWLVWAELGLHRACTSSPKSVLCRGVCVQLPAMICARLVATVSAMLASTCGWKRSGHQSRGVQVGVSRSGLGVQVNRGDTL